MRHPTTKKQQYWAKVVEQAEQSGESLADYARANNLAPQALYRWRCKLKSPTTIEIQSTPPHFAQVVTSPPVNTAMSIEINGVRLRFDDLPQVQWISELIDSQSSGS